MSDYIRFGPDMRPTNDPASSQSGAFKFNMRKRRVRQLKDTKHQKGLRGGECARRQRK